MKRRLSFRSGIPVYDAGEFKESEHPRAKNGQFTSAGGVVGSKIANNVTAPKKGTLSHSIWSAGAKLLEDGKVPNKANVMEALSAQGITANASTVGTQLAHLKKFLQGGKPAAPVETELETIPETVKKLPETKAEFINQVFKKPDMKLEGAFGGKTYYKGSNGEKFSYDPGAKTWMHKSPIGTVTTGSSMNELSDFIEKGKTPLNQPHLSAPAPKPQPPKPKVDHTTLSAPVYAVRSLPATKHKMSSKGIATEAALPEGVQNSIKRYRGSAYTAINSALRFTADFDNTPPQILKDVIHLNRAFQMVPVTTEERQLSRKVQLGALQTMAKHAGISNLADIQVGNVFQDEGVVSTAHSHHTWSGAVKFNITLPKGSRAIDLSETINKGENEVILPPGTRFKVVAVKHKDASTPNQNGHLYEFDVEAIT